MGGSGIDEGDSIADTRETDRYAKSIARSCIGSRTAVNFQSRFHDRDNARRIWICRIVAAKLYRARPNWLHYPTRECKTYINGAAHIRACINSEGGCTDRSQIN